MKKVEKITSLEKLLRSLGRELFVRYVMWEMKTQEVDPSSDIESVVEPYFEFYEREAKDPEDSSRDLINGFHWFRTLRKAYMRMGKSEKLREIIEPFMKGWSWDMASDIVKTLLLAGTAEMLATEVPEQVVISQYVDIGFKYADPKGARFVNAVLDAIKRKHKKGV